MAQRKPMRTDIAWSTTDSITVKGLDVCKDILGKVSLGTVGAQLARETTTAPELAPIQQALEAFSTAPAYQALADVTNHIKHHGGLPVRVGWGDSEQTPFEVLLSAFSRKQQTQPPREIAAFMEETYETMSRVVVTTGLALNEWLRHSTHASA